MVSGTSVSGTKIFAIISVPGAVMMTAVKQVLRLDAEEDVGRHDAAGDVRHAGGHHRHQLRLGHTRKVRPDRQRRLGLAHEDARGHVQRFRAGGAHDAAHQDRKRRTTSCMMPK